MSEQVKAVKNQNMTTAQLSIESANPMPQSPVTIPKESAQSIATDVSGSPIVPEQPDLTSPFLNPTKTALERLVNKLDEIGSHDGFKHVWRVFNQTGQRYNGPTWKDELAAAKSVLGRKPE